jgi:predicted DNA-binding ribbon-helix-helix protein
MITEHEVRRHLVAEKRSMVSFQLEEEKVEQLNKLAADFRMSRSELLRELVEESFRTLCPLAEIVKNAAGAGLEGRAIIAVYKDAMMQRVGQLERAIEEVPEDGAEEPT